MNDIHLHEQFKKYFGYKKAIKCKVSWGLHTGLEKSQNHILLDRQPKKVFQPNICQNAPPSQCILKNLM